MGPSASEKGVNANWMITLFTGSVAALSRLLPSRRSVRSWFTNSYIVEWRSTRQPISLAAHTSPEPPLPGTTQPPPTMSLYLFRDLDRISWRALRNFASRSQCMYLHIVNDVTEKLPTCWTKPGKCDEDLISLYAGGNEGLTGRSHPPRFTTARDGRRIVRMAVLDRTATSRTIAQQIKSVTHHSVSARTIRRCLQQSGMSTRRPLLRLSLTGNYRLYHQWCDEQLACV
ncbi:transposable element Tcb1 transposase [Trichonephila clavipes]|nr:transposable element Tcb1 transposase [Trichonephila clavipes]